MMNAQTAAITGDPNAGQKASRGAGMGRFGVGAGLAGVIMANVGAQLQQAAKAARVKSLQKYVTAPELQSDGTLQSTYIEAIGSFPTAYPPYLSAVVSKDTYLAIIAKLHSILWPVHAHAVSTGSTGDQVMSGMGSQLLAGNIAGMQNPANTHNMAAKAQMTTQTREEAMVACRQALFLVNKETTTAVWALERVQWQTQEYVSPPTGPGGRPMGTGHNRTVTHVRFDLKLSFPGGASALPASAATPMPPEPPAPVPLPPGVTAAELCEAMGWPATAPCVPYTGGTAAPGPGAGAGMPPGAPHAMRAPPPVLAAPPPAATAPPPGHGLKSGVF